MKRLSEFPGMTEEESMYCLLYYQDDFHFNWFTHRTKLIEVEPSSAAIVIEGKHYVMAVNIGPSQFVWATSLDNFKASYDIELENKIYNIQELSKLMV